MSLRDEIYEQPGVLQNLLDRQLDHIREAADAIRQHAIDFVLLAARGTSDHAGIYAQYVWGALNRLPVALAAPSLYTVYEAAPRLSRALVVGISQSGQSPDVVSVIAEGRRQGMPTLAITNSPGSPLAEAAEFVLDLNAGQERAVAATKTYTAELLTLAAFGAALAGDDAHLAALHGVPPAVRAALALEPDLAERAARHRDLEQCVVLGRGYNYATAREWALKLKELAYVLAEPYSTADFQHGPLALIEPGFPVLAVAPAGPARDEVLPLLTDLRQARGAELLVLSDDAEAARALGPAVVPLPAGLPEWLTPLAAIVPAQLYCFHLARAKGHDTEAPRNIRKVTLTH